MARLERCFLPDQPLHIIQRGNNRQPIFFCRDDYLAYRNWLTEAAAKSGCAIHGYVLMTNHVHVLVTPETKNSISASDAAPRAAVRSLYQRRVQEKRHALGRALQGPHRSTAKIICSPACATSNSTPFGPAWWCIRGTILGRAIRQTRMAVPMRLSRLMRSIAPSGAALPIGSRSIVRCFAFRSKRGSSMACARRPWRLGVRRQGFQDSNRKDVETPRRAVAAGPAAQDQKR